MRSSLAPLVLVGLAAAVAAHGEGRVAPVSRPPVSQSPVSQSPGSQPAAHGFAFAGTMSQGGMIVGTAPPGAIALTLDGATVPLAGDGRFLIAFGRDHGPSAVLVATRGDGSAVTDTLTILPRTWRIEALPIPRGTAPTPAFLAIREPELARIKAARAVAAGVASDGWRQRFAWPLVGRISGLFGAQRVYQGEAGSYHTGLDIAEPEGTPVRAPADGVVLLAAKDAPFSLEGHLLMIGHGMGLDSAFLHLSRIDVAVGDMVRRGQVIGAVGMTGRATGPHLHWALTWRGERIDPLLVVKVVGEVPPAILSPPAAP